MDGYIVTVYTVDGSRWRFDLDHWSYQAKREHNAFNLPCMVFKTDGYIANGRTTLKTERFFPLAQITCIEYGVKVVG